MNFFKPRPMSAVEAKYEAQKIAFAPFVFQACKVLRDTGILEAVEALTAKEGATLEAIAERSGQRYYALRVLLEAGLAAGVISVEEGRYRLTKVGFFILRDEMTRVNMDFMHDVCYEGAFYMDEAIAEGKPAGLKVFGQWPTIYEGLSKLPQKAQKSWFDFDHFYSDSAFEQLLPVVLKEGVHKVLDVGGNTGKWSLCCTRYREDVSVTILDLPGQLEKALANAKSAGMDNRISGQALDLLADDSPLPAGHDVIWMSQFLDCFSEEEIVHILTRARKSMTARTRLYILETYWDEQRFEAAAYSLIQTSLYFTVMANGNSRMYHSDDLRECVAKAGLTIEQEHKEVGLSHTLFCCKLP
jgi:hypothetical protein